MLVNIILSNPFGTLCPLVSYLISLSYLYDLVILCYPDMSTLLG